MKEFVKLDGFWTEVEVGDDEGFHTTVLKELIKVQKSCFQCPDCGYKVQYEEFREGNSGE